MRILLTLQMTITIDILPDDPSANAANLQTAAECVQCGWTKLYSSKVSASRGLAAHKRHCRKTSSDVKQAFERLVDN